MKFGSVCSGIEAASVAWHPLGWKAAWLSEIEPFPSAVLAHHYPDVPNLGDMKLLPDRIASGEVEAPDLFCGGTPCQAFSVAGLRKSLDDARGNLSLVFCEIVNAIDTVRAGRNEPASIIFWENVPGVLSTKDNAFGCFLAGLAGEDNPLEPPRGKWTNAGYVLGPKRAVAWRLLDAQYFGVAQRRRRVFVVASARDDFDPASVLFEFDGLRRDSAPSREARQGVAGGIEIGPGGGRFTDLNPTLDTRAKDGPIRNQLAGAVMQPLAYTTKLHNTQSNQAGKVYEEYATSLDANSPPPAVFQPIAFHPTQDPISSTDGTTHGLGCGSSGGQASVAVAQPIAIQDVRPIEKAQNGRGWNDDGTAYTVDTRATQGVAQPIGWSEELTASVDLAGTIQRGGSGGRPDGVMQTNMAVRRLTPVECERLQGFPDGYTQIPWRKKPADECPDGPRYKTLGNSWAVPVVRWIGSRIDRAIK
jgi:DNA (cytosine-5)-methyltransferase 1